jgi:SAM-dependent methyltransferase
MKFPDIAHWYSPQKARDEEVAWILTDSHKADLAFLLPRLEQHQVKNVLEVGCGSGILAAGLPLAIEYTGIDLNTWFLERARSRSQRAARRFVCFDARNYEHGEPADLVVAVAFLKHFSLEEHDRILAHILRQGQYAFLGVQVADREVDTGTEFHHIFVTREHLGEAIKVAGHEVVEEAVNSTWDQPPDLACRGVYLWTKKVAEVAPAAPVKEASAPQDEPETRWHVQRLTVDGLVAHDLDEYTLRWVARHQGGFEPVLYFRGKRVTGAWSLTLDGQQAADPFGGNANTSSEK